MNRFRRCLIAVPIAAAGVIGVQQQPAGALSAAVMTGSGWMSNASGPGMTGGPVSGTISGTAVGSFGACTFSSPFNGVDSIIQGQGESAPFGCWSSCAMSYQRVAQQILMQGNCWGSSFQLAGLTEPNSALPTNSYLFQVTGVDSAYGPIAIQGNITFAGAAGTGVDPGTLLQTTTNIGFHGSLTGYLGGFVGSCTLNMNGVGSESFAVGTSSLAGSCSGPGGTTWCTMQWTHLATHTVVTGSCSGPLGFGLEGTGEIFMGAGGSYTFNGVVAVT